MFPLQAQRVGRGIAVLFHDHSTRRGEWSAARPGLIYPLEKPGTHCTGGWVGPRAGLDRCGKSRITGIRSPDRPSRSQSLYRLSYPAHYECQVGKDLKWRRCGFVWKFCFCLCLMELEELQDNCWRGRDLNLAHFEYRVARALYLGLKRPGREALSKLRMSGDTRLLPPPSLSSWFSQ